RPHFQAFFLAEGIDEEFALEVGAQPVVALDHLGFGIGDFFLVKEFAELLQRRFVHFEALRDLVSARVALSKIKQRVVLQQRVLELGGLVGCKLHVRSDAAAAIHRASAVRELDLVVGVILFPLAIIVIIVEREIGVIALDQASAGGVVLRGGEGQAGIFRQRIHGLHQALAERDFANDKAAIVVLNS